jgi:hypothetical protein
VIGGCSANFTHTAPTAADVAAVAKVATAAATPKSQKEAAIVAAHRKPNQVDSTTHRLTGLLGYLIGPSN